MNVILASMTGCLLGMLVAWVTDCPPEFFRIVYVLTGIGEPRPTEERTSITFNSVLC